MSEDTLYERLLAHAVAISPKFAGAHEKETFGAFAGRLLGVLSTIPDDRDTADTRTASLVWADLRDDEGTWINNAIDAKEASSAWPELEGYPVVPLPSVKKGAVAADKKAAGKKGAAKAAPEPEPVAAASDKPSKEELAKIRSDRMKAINEKRRAEKAGTAPTTTSAPAHAAKPEKAKTAKAAKVAGVAKEPADDGIGFIIRSWTAQNPDGTREQLKAHLVSIKRDDIKDSSIQTFHHAARAMIACVKKAGHWK